MYPKICVSCAALILALTIPVVQAQTASAPAHPLAELPLREIGPGYPSGRIADFAFHPEKRNIYYAAVASGGLWRTTDDAATWEPLFDHEGSYAIGVVELDPQQPNTIWVGTGENNAQRSVAAGDGVYRSDDGGKTWRNMGLKDSGHISQIWIHPRERDTLLVAAQGPLWRDGGDRGLYRSTDGGATWSRILHVDEHTGVNEFVVDPRDPDIIVASTYQRRRHVWTLINGGPGSGIQRSNDGGRTWSVISAGLPKDHMGRIGLAAAPSQPDWIYAIIEAADDEKGTYLSRDFGLNWEKRSDHIASSPQYYQELVVDPHEPARLYSLSTYTRISEDAGRTWSKLSLDHRHVDDHALWIDPADTAHLIIGGDGGIYESWDRGQSWAHVDNLPVTQFYRVTPDNALPFYNVCGGTQDNNSLCAPSRTTQIHGITNADWRTILGGDGYKPQFDPTDPNIIYAQWQYGGLARYDRRTGERVYIAPQPGADELEPKWNWNTPLLVSPHAPRRLYYAAERLYRSDDRGDTWTVVSPDLTRQLDRNELEVMGRVWSVDSIAKNDSTSRYGSIIGLSESPLVEGLIFVGSDDGLISVTGDGGKNWHTERRFRGVPQMAYVDDVLASVHDPDVAYAVIDNHKRGDFKPYVLKTSNRGKSWQLISGDLPERGFAHTISEDHVDPQLLFVGTELGLYFSQDGGGRWHEFTDLPTIAVRDLEIQRRENDLVIGTFGRGIHILDDYSALRSSPEMVGKMPTLFPVRDPWLYIEADYFDDRVRGSRGANFWRADNPPYGAVFSYHLPEAIERRAKTRRQREIQIEKDGGDTPYPSWEALRAEDREPQPAVLLIVRDAAGMIVRRLEGETAAGYHRTAWDLRLPPPDPVDLQPDPDPPYWHSPPMGPLALPGTYTVELLKRQSGELSILAGPREFRVRALALSPEITDDRAGLQAFQREAGELYRQVAGAARRIDETDTRIQALRLALRVPLQPTDALQVRLEAAESALQDIKQRVLGDATRRGRNASAPWPLKARAEWVYTAHLESQSAVPGAYRESLTIAAAQYAELREGLRAVLASLDAIEQEGEALGAPWTPGRLPGG